MFMWISVCIAPLCLSIVWYFPFIWSLVYLLFLSLFIVIAVFVLTLWGHVSLSSPHQTSLFLLDKVEKDIRQIEESLKVRHIYLIIFLNLNYCCIDFCISVCRRTRQIGLIQQKSLICLSYLGALWTASYSY